MDSAPDSAREVWLLMSDLVLDNMRRRQVAEALGMSFGRARALRRLARRPQSMRELATALGIDPPNATVVVDELERQGLVVRQPHPTDRRVKTVVLTDKGRHVTADLRVRRSVPPPAFAVLSAEEQRTLRDLLSRVTAADASLSARADLASAG